MLLVVDNGSVFTKNLTDFFLKKNISFEIQTFDNTIRSSILENYDSFILSGRRKNEKKINEINSKIINILLKNKKLLGICYGAEILALTLGGTIRKMKFVSKRK